MKQAFTYDEIAYISNSFEMPKNIDFDAPEIGTTEDLSVGYSLMGTGYQNLNEAPNAETEETAYINQKSKTTITKSYNNKWSGTADKIVDEKAVMTLFNIAYYQKTGEQAELNLISIDTLQPYGTKDGVFKARMARVSCAITNITKDATNKVNFDFELSSTKDVVFGVYDKNTKIFTVTDTEKEPEIIVPPISGGEENGGSEMGGEGSSDTEEPIIL